MKITVLYHPDDINMMFTLWPLLKSRHSRAFDFTLDPAKALSLGNKRAVVFKFWKYAEKAGGREYLKRLRDRSERLCYFDDLADPRQVMSGDLDLFDLYFKKSMLVDRDLYRKEYYGNRLYTDHYHRAFGVVDEKPEIAKALGEGEIAKLRLAWNIGVGSYPKTRLRKAVATRLGGRDLARAMGLVLANPLAYRSEARKAPKVSAHFRMFDEQRTVTFQRELFLKAAAPHPGLFLGGKVPLKEYNREMRVAAATLSPFGWGEVCFRDFEAVINRSVLLKPSMDHIETYPNVYRRGETYLALDWDALDLVAETERCLGDEGLRKRLTEAAYEAYRAGIEGFESKVEAFIEQVGG
jgi:hypothetical protein